MCYKLFKNVHYEITSDVSDVLASFRYPDLSGTRNLINKRKYTVEGNRVTEIQYGSNKKLGVAICLSFNVKDATTIYF